MAVSLVQQELREKYAEEQTNLEVKMFEAEEKLGNYVDVRQRIKLPADYCPISQIVKLKFGLPKVVIVNVKDTDENSECREISFVLKETCPPISAGFNTDLNTNLELKQDCYQISVTDFLDKERQQCEFSDKSLMNRSQNGLQTGPSEIEQDGKEDERYKNRSFSFSDSLKLYRNKLKQHNVACKGSIIPVGKVQDTIQAYNILVNDLISPEKVGKVARKSIEDLTRNRLAYPDTTVKAKKKMFEAVLPQTRKALNRREHQATLTKQATELPIEKKVEEFFDSNQFKNINYRKFPFMPNISSRSSYDTLRNYLVELNHLNEDEDSRIVKELVLSRFKHAVENVIQRSGRRRKLSCQDGSQETSSFSRDSGNSSVNGENPGSNEEMFNFHELSSSTIYENDKNSTFVISKNEINTTDEKCSDMNEKSNRLESFDEKTFLDVALGQELADTSDLLNSDSQQCPRDSVEANSVGTSNLSELISAYDIYSTIDHTSKRNRRSVATYASVSSSREFVIKYSEPGTEVTEITEQTTPSPLKVERDDAKLMEEFHKQTCITSQVSKALHLCQKRNDFYECIERVEAERVLLIATLRKQAIMQEMGTSDHKNMKELKIGYVRLSDIVVPLTWSPNSSIYTRFFVGIFRCGTTLFSSGLLSPNEEMKLEINDWIHFEELSSDFEITFQIYSMYAKITHGQKNTSLSFKDCSQKVIKKLFSPKKKTDSQNTDEYTLKEPSFILYGKGSICRTSMKDGTFMIHNVFPRIPIAETLKCTVDVLAKLTNKMSGFLTVGEKKTETLIWNRQWCVLQGSEMTFWDFPAQEQNDAAPKRVIDLVRCSLIEMTQTNTNMMSRPRTIHLRIGSKSAEGEYNPENIYLSADTETYFSSWKDELNSVLKSLSEWDCFKK